MKASKEQNFEKTLPSGYTQALYINAKSAKFGIVFNLIAFAVWGLVVAAAFLFLHLGGKLTSGLLKVGYLQLSLAYLVLIGAMVGYIVLHELVHGFAYKKLTGEKPTFGISWSCAFCGVPNIYVYRKASIIALAAPLVLLSLLLMPIAAVAFIIALEGGSVAATAVFLGLALLIGMHVGGCSGDIYLLLLFIFKFKKGSTLVRDTGPEQFIYVKVSDSVSDSASVRNSL